MQEFKSGFLREAAWRGFIHQGTNLEQLDSVMSEGSITAYIGFDATAKSLHVGSLIQIMWLRLLQKHGHKPIVVMGDGTTRIGDPSGKDAQRQILTLDDIDANVNSIQEIFSSYITFGNGNSDAIIVRNSEWLVPLNYLDFLGHIGRHFSINRMLTFDSVRLRLEREQPLSFLEFNYMIFQAYDFLHLNNQYNCTLQLGGSDQWGNIVNGTELIRRVNNKEAFGLTSPLLSTADGKKMGKTAQGAMWLRADMLSPFDFWQFWRNTHDQDVGRFLKLFTDMTEGDIAQLVDLDSTDINQAKRVLADEVTKLCHGQDAIQDIHTTVATLFENAGGDLSSLPFLELGFTSSKSSYALVDLLKESGLASSNSEARRLIRGLGVRLRDHIIDQEDMQITATDFEQASEIKLSAGRKRHVVLRLKS